MSISTQNMPFLKYIDTAESWKLVVVNCRELESECWELVNEISEFDPEIWESNSEIWESNSES